MLKSRDVTYLDNRLCEIMACDEPFGGIVVVLVGDVAQLLPVGARCGWHCDDNANGDILKGYNLFKAFKSVAFLR